MRQLIKHKNKFENYSKDYKNRVACYAVMNTEGKMIKISNMACHYGLSRSYEPYGIPEYIIDSVQDLAVQEDTAKLFLEWLLNYSPFQECFVSRNPRTVLSHGVRVLQTEVPANLVAGALFAGRAISEHKGYIARLWGELVKHGVHPNVAFYYSHVLTGEQDSNLSYSPINWHVSIDGMSEAYLPFIKGKPSHPDKTFKELKRYNLNVHSLWSDDEIDETRANIKSWMAKNLVKKSTPSSNPFAKKPVNNGVMSFNESIEALSEHLIQSYKGIVN